MKPPVELVDGQVSLVTFLIFAVVFCGLSSVMLLIYTRKRRILEKVRARLGTAISSEGEALLRDIIDLEDTRKARWLGQAIPFAIAGVFIGLLINSTLIAVLLIGMGVVLAWGIHEQKRNQYRVACDRQLPQALEIMAMSLRSGASLPAALQAAAMEAPDPIRSELGRINDEHQLGRPLGESLRAFALRMGQKARTTQQFVVAVRVLQETGGNLIMVLDQVIEGARQYKRFTERAKALTSEGRSAVKFMGCMPLVSFLISFFLNGQEQVSSLLYTSRGHAVLGIGLLAWASGMGVFYVILKPMREGN